MITAVGSYMDRSKALVSVLNADIQVGHGIIDRMSIKELRRYIKDNGGDFSSCKKLADYRLSALEVKQVKRSAEGGNDAEYEFYVPQLASALTDGSERDINRAILQMFFEEYDPSRLGEIESLLEKYNGEEDELFADLAWKYPDHANKIVAFSINATYGEVPSSTVNKSAADNRRRPSFVVSAVRHM